MKGFARRPRTPDPCVVIPPMLPWDLEDWLTDEGDKVVRKAAAANSRDALDAGERLLYELWLFDTEQRNGGVSQYFCNRGLEHWDALSRLATPALPCFSSFAAKVNEVVARSDDPYQAVIESDVHLDDWYDEHQTRLVDELRKAVRPTG
jgi:hypothetical protein